MALEKQRVIDKLEIVRGPTIQIRYRDMILENGIEIASSFHRECVGPLDSLEGKDQMVLDIANIIFTPEVIAIAQAQLVE